MTLTIRGEVAVEDLIAEDLVWTEEAGFEPLLWVGAKTVTLNALKKHPNLAPVTFAAGSLGEGLPARTLTVTRHHRTAITTNGRHDAATVITPKKNFVGMTGVKGEASLRERTFYHLLLKQQHAVRQRGSCGKPL